MKFKTLSVLFHLLIQQSMKIIYALFTLTGRYLPSQTPYKAKHKNCIVLVKHQKESNVSYINLLCQYHPDLVPIPALHVSSFYENVFVLDRYIFRVIVPINTVTTTT